MTKETKEGLLSRWSKRKLSDAEEEVIEVQQDEVAPEVDEEYENLLQANREAAEAIDLNSIDKESDLSLFMKEGVPELLKRQALSTLWRSSSVFANVDGLVDYDDDFGSKDLIMKTFKSAYQVGQGYFQDIEDDEVPEGQIQSAASDNSETEELTEPDENEPKATDDDFSEPEEDSLASYAVEPELELDTKAEQEHEPVPIQKVSLRSRLSFES